MDPTRHARAFFRKKESLANKVTPLKDAIAHLFMTEIIPARRFGANAGGGVPRNPGKEEKPAFSVTPRPMITRFYQPGNPSTAATSPTSSA
jgi:hypothetical protein